MAGKKVKGKNFVAVDERFDDSEKIYRGSRGKLDGIAEKLKKSEKEQGYSKILKVKPQKKVQKPVSGRNKINY